MHMVKLIDNQEKYWNFILQLRNENRFVFKNTEIITKEEHKSFMEKYGTSYKICLLKVDFEEVPVGFIGVVDGDIRLCVDSTYQRMGIGEFMLREILKDGKDYSTMIKVENEASLKLFKKCGFDVDFLYLRN